MKNSSKKKICRLCNSSNVKVALKLNESPLCDAYIKKKRKQQFYDLNLCLCNDCKFAQIDTIVDPKTIYRDYIYVTSSSLGLVNHFKKYSIEVCKLLKFKQSKLVVDIGSSDGTLLSFFKKMKHRALGVEPSYRAAAEAKDKGIKSFTQFFNVPLAKRMVDKHGYADLITINNLFANVDDLYNFTKSLNLLLGREGVIVIESSYLKDMINNMVFDFIYHEHLSYFSILPLKSFFMKFGLKLVRVQKINTKGGSLRYYWAREESKWKIHNSVTKLVNLEKKFNISKKTFKQFNKKINKNKKKIIDYLHKYKKLNVVGYGASATSTTLISHYKLNNMIKYLVDDNPSKINTFSPGYHIPVYELKKIITDRPDIVIIFAWRYKKSIFKKLKKIGFKKKIILPLPNFKVI